MRAETLLKRLLENKKKMAFPWRNGQIFFCGQSQHFVTATWSHIIFFGQRMTIMSINESYLPFPHNLWHCNFQFSLSSFKVDFRCCRIDTHKMKNTYLHDKNIQQNREDKGQNKRQMFNYKVEQEAVQYRC